MRSVGPAAGAGSAVPGVGAARMAAQVCHSSRFVGPHRQSDPGRRAGREGEMRVDPKSLVNKRTPPFAPDGGWALGFAGATP